MSDSKISYVNWTCVVLSMMFCGFSPAIASADTIFYLHGRIIELEGVQPVHDRFGLYDYNGIVKALEADGATVISNVRSGDINVSSYARDVAGKIDEMIESGVAAESITVVGFSKGGMIAIYVSNILGRSDINFVFLAACSSWIKSYPNLTVNGNILSIYEKSDSLAGSCKKLVRRNDAISSFQEIRLKTGKEHGAFYLPRPAWLDPLLIWIAAE